MKEHCGNCIYRKTLWWWVYNDDGKIDHKHYGDCCILFANEEDGAVMKLDKVDLKISLCEMFTPKKGGAKMVWQKELEGEKENV